MDLNEQNKLADEIGKLVQKRLKEAPFHLSIAAVEKTGDAFAFSVTNLTQKDSFENCKIIVRGIVDEANGLVDKFQFPSGVKINKPLEFK